MPKPKVSIIIVNLNGGEFLDVCLSSLKKQTYRDFEVIVVDNFSTDNSLKLLEEKYSGFTRVIRNQYNTGFARGNNIGIMKASGDLIITLNNDIEADERWLEELVNSAQADEKIGMCASKIRSYYRRDIIDSAGVNIYWDGMSRGRGRMEVDSGQYDAGKEIFIPSACAALYKKEMLDEIGLFDEDFFAYCEDTDLGLRGRLAGWKCVLSPRAIVYHFYSATGGRYSSFKAFMVERNHIWVALKSLPIWILAVAPLFTFIRLIIQGISLLKYKFPVKNKRDTGLLLKMQIILTCAKAYFYAFKELPYVLKKRRLIRSNRKAADFEVFDWFIKFKLEARDLVLD
ncbi:MAG: glycosyltransferase family 2 protein [Candidatus Omnitrophota bacterium]|nr:glycosyltransferase family 2 protein [Candidatus Omnitrophota bacterium]MBU1928552.1 glycosyltransferase family 2 protein [Candidatus Omnitrophota bacterium]MBU2034912.1 glycosyltransferase family 2 protein [Candidatus Omnitrophota bacterium]MBU2221370.1 glycosyltransferase family 2 protein [Candidatus Omnitrophota bacterium]MBU2258409.1 glycosyltransferase family 2 protein [Candidatus Omnitrophota bacterium]